MPPGTLCKPTLILVPNRLIEQWLIQLELVAPRFFTLYKYYGDARRHDPVAGEKVFHGRLNRQHAIFDGSLANASTIVISSYSTFTERHGPSSQKKWHINRCHMSRTAADTVIDDLDPRWPERLDHMFGFVVLDEAHIIKQTSNKTSIAIKWLKAQFHILVTATPIPNGIDDWRGYMPLIEHQDADAWWTPGSLAVMGFAEDRNPYELDDGHPASKLQMTTRAARDWIYAARIDPTMKGIHLAWVWQRCMLRRTYSSRIPFGTGPTIGSKLPTVNAVIINCMYDEKERLDYHDVVNELTGALFLPGSSDRRKVKWSLSMQRKLQMSTTFLELPGIDANWNLKATNLKKLFEDREFYLQWFPEERRQNPEAMLWELCRGAPKVRALLRNIRSHVSTPPYLCRSLQLILTVYRSFETRRKHLSSASSPQ